MENPEITRILAKLRSMEKEKAPAMVLDVGDAKILLAYIAQLEWWAEGTDPGAVIRNLGALEGM